MLPAPRTLACALALSLICSPAGAAPAISVDSSVTLPAGTKRALAAALGRAAKPESSCDEPGCVAPAVPAAPSRKVSARVSITRANAAAHDACRVTISARRGDGQERRASANTPCNRKDLVAAATLLWQTGIGPSLAGKTPPSVTVVVIDDDDRKGVNADGLRDAGRQRGAAAATRRGRQRAGADGDSDADSDADGRDVDADALLKTAKRTPRGVRYRTIFELAFATQLIGRSFNFTSPVEPRTPAEFQAASVLSLGVALSVYPFVPFSRNPLAEIGLRFAYRGSLGASAQIAGSPAAVELTHDNADLGLVYRWNILRRASSVQLNFAFDIGYQRMRWGENASVVPLPNISHTYLKFTPLDIRVPFYSSHVFGIGLEAHFAFLALLSSGDIERTDSGGWGGASGSGLDAGGGLYARLHIFELASSFDYRRIAMSFDGVCYRQRTGCNYAGGAVDATTMFSIRAAVKY